MPVTTNHAPGFDSAGNCGAPEHAGKFCMRPLTHREAVNIARGALFTLVHGNGIGKDAVSHAVQTAGEHDSDQRAALIFLSEILGRWEHNATSPGPFAPDNYQRRQFVALGRTNLAPIQENHA